MLGAAMPAYLRIVEGYDLRHTLRVAGLAPRTIPLSAVVTASRRDENFFIELPPPGPAHRLTLV